METEIIQFSAGRGPEECAWVVAKVFKAFLAEVKEHKFNYEILQQEKGNANTTIQSVTIKIQGAALSKLTQQWLGTIQWIGTSTFRKFHKRKNWFIGCFKLSNLNEVSFKEHEIQFQAIRSSGPGGQHVNKVSSAIRAKHLPTGIQVLVSDSRSQHQNKKIALQRLQAKLTETNIEKLKEQVQQQWGNHLNLQRGNPIKVFKGNDFKPEKKDTSYKKKRNQLKNDLRKLL